MKFHILICAGVLTLGGCADLRDFAGRIVPGASEPATEEPAAADEAAAPLDPFARQADEETAGLGPVTAAPPPPATARTAEALDTTTEAQRAAATAEPAGETNALGRTVASLGDPTEPGLWLKTPLVSTETEGRVTNLANGKSARVTLLPLEGPLTAGSRMSLSGLRLIEAPLTDLTEVEVAREG